MGKNKIITEEEWIKTQDYVAVIGEEALVGATRPIFTSAISIAPYVRRTGNPTKDPLGGGCRMLRESDFAKMEMAFRIEFECCGAASAAFLEEFMKLVDKYNHWEQSVYLRPQPPKKNFGKRMLQKLGIFRKRR